MKSADARVLRASSSLPGKLQLTSPLPSQSNSGPTPSLSSAMYPSRETAATPMIVLPIVRAFLFEDPAVRGVRCGSRDGSRSVMLDAVADVCGFARVDHANDVEL